jgi:decaprenyl-phosphate phosphoribosyltransferase
VIIDILSLAVFFYLRIKAGSVIAVVDMSHWIIFLAFLLAIFLGLNKRRQEIKLIVTDRRA